MSFLLGSQKKIKNGKMDEGSGRAALQQPLPRSVCLSIGSKHTLSQRERGTSESSNVLCPSSAAAFLRTARRTGGRRRKKDGEGGSGKKVPQKHVANHHHSSPTKNAMQEEGERESGMYKKKVRDRRKKHETK